MEIIFNHLLKSDINRPLNVKHAHAIRYILRLLFASCLFFAIFFYLFRALNTPAVSLISIALVSFISWNYGTFAGLTLSLLNIAWISITFLIVDPDMLSNIRFDSILGASLHMLFSLIIGYFGSISRKLQYEIEERKKVEAKLKTYQSELEQKIEERTRELEAVHEKLRQAERIEAIGKLSGEIAHDFKNYLTIILGYANLLLKNFDKTTQEYDFVQQIEKSGHNALQLTSQLLTFARKEKYAFQPLNMRKLMNDVVALLSRSIGRNITLRHTIPVHLPRVMGGSLQIQNAIVNLAINARDAMPNGGIITISAETVDVTPQYCAEHNLSCLTGPYVAVIVNDTGCGLTPELKKHIFEPFYTTKEEGKGTGMGLAAVYGIVCSHNGTVFVESEPGNGATFTMLFPGLPEPGDGHAKNRAA